MDDKDDDRPIHLSINDRIMVRKTRQGKFLAVYVPSGSKAVQDDCTTLLYKPTYYTYHGAGERFAATELLRSLPGSSLFHIIKEDCYEDKGWLICQLSWKDTQDYGD